MMGNENANQMNFFSEMSEYQITAREFFSTVLLDSLYRNFGFNDMILSILVYTLFSRMFDLMQPPAVKHSIAVV